MHTYYGYMYNVMCILYTYVLTQLYAFAKYFDHSFIQQASTGHLLDASNCARTKAVNNTDTGLCSRGKT